MLYNLVMENKKQYTEEEIKNMSYWQLWSLRRNMSLWYYIIVGALYGFLTYAAIKILIIFYTKNFENGFKLDWWIIPILLLLGPVFYYGHELYYKNIYLKKKQQ